jgi:hypothetical protein
LALSYRDHLLSVSSLTVLVGFWLASRGLHSWASNWFSMVGCPFVVCPSARAENWALQYSQIPSTGRLANRFTILRWRCAMNTVSHRPESITTPDKT